jgi:hypothetical protein
MKKVIFIFLLLLCFAPFAGVKAATTNSLTQRLMGRIVVAVQSHGEAYYISPKDQQAHSLGSSTSAISVLAGQGLGISEKDFNIFSSSKAPKRLSGRILLRVQTSGEAYYVNPLDLKLYSLNGFNPIYKFGLGVSNADIANILNPVTQTVGVCSNLNSSMTIQPATIKNQLIPGSTFTQKITLWSDSPNNLTASIDVDAPKIASWISIDRGNGFVLPKGKSQITMLITFKIPENATPGDYTGLINIKTCQKSGIGIPIDLTVSQTVQKIGGGFGISPPLIQNHQLTPGSTYKQEIMLLRGNPDEDSKVQVDIAGPEIYSWISIDKGNSFILPKGQYRVPIVVTFKVPMNAALGDYVGYMDIKVSSADESVASSASIALGSRVDIDLALTNIVQSDFLVRLISVPDFIISGSPKIKVVMNLENKGNVKTAPSQVAIEVWDSSKQKMLQSSVDKSINQIDPFSTTAVTAEFPTNLPPGQYLAKIRVYKEQGVVNYYEIAFTIIASKITSGNTSSTTLDSQ